MIHNNNDFTEKSNMMKEVLPMSRKEVFPKALKNQSIKPKYQKSQINGQTEVSLHNQLLRIDAKARQY